MSSGPGVGHRVGEGHHLGRVAQVDADDPQPVQPVAAVRHRGEPADRVVREAGGDGGVRAVAEQPQRDVHADLRPAAGEQRPAPGEVGAGVAAGVVQRRARRTQLVVEGVDLVVALLADVAGACAVQGSDRGGRGRRGQGEALGLVVDAPGGGGGGRGGHRPVGGHDLRVLVLPAAHLDALVQARRGTPDAHRVGVVHRQGVQLGEDGQAGRQAFGVDAGGGRVVTGRTVLDQFGRCVVSRRLIHRAVLAHRHPCRFLTCHPVGADSTQAARVAAYRRSVAPRRRPPDPCRAFSK